MLSSGFVELFEKDSWERLLMRLDLSPEKLVAQIVDSEDGAQLTTLTCGEQLKAAKSSALQVCTYVPTAQSSAISRARSTSHNLLTD